MGLVALTRAVPDSLAGCQLTHLSRVPIDVARARAQHGEYEAALASLGCRIVHIPPAHDAPDSVFVEDIAIVLDDVAVMGRPGAPSRLAESAGVAETVARFRPVKALAPPATLDGGDVLRLGRTLYVGTGGRTNAAAVDQLGDLVRPHAFEVRAIAARGCLHLKSAATELAPGLVLCNPAWVDPVGFAGHRAVTVDPSEPHAANVLRIDGTILCASAYDRTSARIEAAGLRLRPLDVSELAKAEAGLTCCSLIFDVVNG